MTTSEFPRPLRLDMLGEAPHAVTLHADAEERAALARRFAIQAIDRLDVTAQVRREGATAFAEGRVTADVVQNCAVTGVPLPTTVEEPFQLRFVAETAGDPAEEIELSAEDCDTLTYAGGAIDLGEAAAETLLLALDPFPRAPDADVALKEAGVVGEEAVGPFAALKALKDKLGG